MPCGKMESMIVFGIPEPQVPWLTKRDPGSWPVGLWIECSWWEEDIVLAHLEEIGEWAW